MNSTDQDSSSASGGRWLNRTVVGIGLASLFSDWAHETATAVLPVFLGTLGASAAWLGLIEGVSDGLASFAKLASGHATDKLQRRKPIAVAGYLVTALATAAFGLATAAWHVLVARSAAWLGRGVRTPVRKALLAAAVDRSAYGRAFGFERMMDTLGAIAGPATAFFLLHALPGHYSTLFAVTLIPGLIAAGLMAVVVKERERKPVPRISFAERLRLLPAPYRKLLVAAGLFGMGSFAHTMLILLAVRMLTPQFGAGRAACIAVLVYILHNVCNAASASIGGWLGDRIAKKWLLAAGYSLGAIMSACIAAVPSGVFTVSIIFSMGGISAALEETLEDSYCAELVEEKHQGTAFGVLATVNGIGDFLSSIIVGLLWTAAGPTAAFGYSAVLCAAGACLVARIRST